MADRICSAEGCDRRSVARGMCNAHYLRWHTGRPMGGPLQPRAERAPRGCLAPECGRPHYGSGWCDLHYDRWRRWPTRPRQYGAALLEASFWRRVEKQPDGCWLWTGASVRGGYGNINRYVDGVRRAVVAHRFAYELLVGPVPDGLDLDHLCNIPACVNPDHLEPVTPAENNRRRSARAKVAAGG